MTRAEGFRIVVAGGGAVGVVTALALARAGARVTLADPSPPGGNASSIAAGMLAPVLECLFDKESPKVGLLRWARDLWPEVAQSVGLTLKRAGAMGAGTSEEVEAWVGGLADLGVEARALSPGEARCRAPWLTAGFGALWTSEDWRLEPLAALAALRGAAEDCGVQWMAVSVDSFDRGVAILSDGGRLTCDALVVATGASPSLVDVAPELAAITPIKGHILRAPALTLEGPVVRLKDVYICPADGGALVGSTMEVGRADTDVDALAVTALRERAVAAASVFAGTPLIACAGVRAATPDGLPLVGAGQTPGVWLAAGTRRNGWLLAPLIAQALVEAMIDQRTSPWARDFDPARFERGDHRRLETRYSCSIPSPI
jgi:glycine oxidase